MRIIQIAVFASLLAATTVHAADMAAAEKKAKEVCGACHQPDGNSTNPQYPILAGQHPDFLRKALQDYQTGARNNAIMAGMAKPLTKAEIEGLAAWFAAQPSGLLQHR